MATSSPTAASTAGSTDSILRSARAASAVPRAAALANVGWMTFVWATRIRNAAGDADATSSAKAGAYALSATMLVGAAAIAASTLRRPTPLAATAVLRGVTALHAGVWVVRGAQIATGEHSGAFIAVHEGLAAVSVGLAAWAWIGSRPASVKVGGVTSGATKV